MKEVKKVYQVYLNSPRNGCSMWLLFPSAELRRQFLKMYKNMLVHLEARSGRRPIEATPWDLPNTRDKLDGEGFKAFVSIWDNYISKM